jgi:hypothetical protein
VRLILVGSILLSMAMPSSAVTLGRHGGAAVIGRPLDIRVEVLAGPGEDVSELCVRADVLFGESRLASGAVRVSPQRSAPDAKVSIRIQTTQPVNEPVVALDVSVGCAAPFSRRYVLLADPAPASANDVAAGVGRVPEVASADSTGSNSMRVLPRAGAEGDAATSGSLPATARAGAGAGVTSSVASIGSNASDPVSPANSVKPVPPKKAQAAPVARRSVVRKPAPEPEAAAPRLHLDPVDVNLGIERDPVLKLSLSLVSEPTTSEQERAAAGQLWKAINATPEDVLRDSQKLAVLEAESKGLREKEARDEAALRSMQSQLDQTRYITWLAYFLGGLLALSLLGLWFFRRRKERPEAARRGPEWWDGAKTPASASARATSSNPQKLARRGRQEPVGVDIDLDADPESSFDDYESLHGHDSSLRAVLPSSNARGEDSQPPAGARSMATEELIDVQQQADFFVSLGEFDKAIGVLKNHLAESQEPSALAYLDLFRLYRQQNRRQDYEELREVFNHKFNAGAPPFDEYSDSSVGLEGYETAFGRIQALWPQPRVLDVIEKSIFRDANDEEGEVFDLEAYRELLLLHAVAKEMIKRAELGDDEQHPDFEHTAIKPLKAAAGVGVIAGAAAGAGSKGGADTEPFVNLPVSSPRLGLDVDLDALDEMSAFEASLPEVPATIQATAGPGGDRLAGSVAEEGNLIDFEVLDFMPPDEDEEEPPKKS